MRTAPTEVSHEKNSTHAVLRRLEKHGGGRPVELLRELLLTSDALILADVLLSTGTVLPEVRLVAVNSSAIYHATDGVDRDDLICTRWDHIVSFRIVQF